jgi:hypothetical protein
MTDIDCFCYGADPNVIVFGVVKGHDGVHARPLIIVGMYAEAAV